MSLAKLTSLSTQTLSLLLERQRLQSLSPADASGGTNNPLHLSQITRNLTQLRSGIIEVESTGDHSEATVLLRNQYIRMCRMVGADADVEPIPEPATSQEDEETEPWRPPGTEKPKQSWPINGDHVYTPYTDDPEAGRDPTILLQEQRRLLDGTWCADFIMRGHTEYEDHPQIKTYTWIPFRTRSRVSVTCRCRLMTSSRYILACWRSWIMISITPGIVLAGLVNDLDVSQRAQRNMVSTRSLNAWNVSLTDRCDVGSALTIALLILILLVLIIIFKT
jgi:hypothetical protein